MITPDYRRQITAVHLNHTWGNHGWKAMPTLLSMILRHKIRNPTVLDFGAGERTLEREAKWAMPHIRVTSYDPGIPGIDTLPNGTWDMTICTDVMEHVEEQFVDRTLDFIREHTVYAAYFGIATKKAKQLLPDGRNAHLTIREPAWWFDQLARRWGEVEVVPGKGFSVVVHS